MAVGPEIAVLVTRLVEGVQSGPTAASGCAKTLEIVAILRLVFTNSTNTIVDKRLRSFGMRALVSHVNDNLLELLDI